jgi:hypothetical protein
MIQTRRPYVGIADSSNQGVFTPDPRDAGCAGVGNMSKTYPSFQPPDEFVLLEGLVSAGSQGLHAMFQAARLGYPNLPDGSAEDGVGPSQWRQRTA